VESSSLQNLVADDCNWIAVPTSTTMAAAVSDLFGHSISRGPLPDDAMNPGRALRCLLMSYLC
jgi:hypothetical protein